ncbi:heat-inducible transcriptional repressor HrcA [Rothia sp. BD8]|uniref:Heat-inducible transcription repressor HrcA n=5 Tax=Rothia kristinae TaxID=37923 RepID=A0A199NTN9_9MICC|nr:heat-inducible transcriptional repressor HrcA [Rothia kristinae]KTR73493.1 HrcA family transcriptional regulator [Rothia kristinae]KTR76474.1 HrcA family transcriptional regulator [Rothia kristinae]MBG7587960.1 heat-inducible transcriptional repressor HrcA [Rothia kristinae]OAX51963.1 heat-inducible transcriptional repressor HrcA [Rothia kristinae]WGH08498.1 heat-inducible transcriptional repressor HrcA [Rothia kristinae]
MNHLRRLEVLSAIVEDYVHSREPVGSKALVERHRLGVSSATVRNDMAALEDEGLIAAPHASAGRIPTDKGYRAFVDRIDAVRPLTPAQRRVIVEFLGSSHDLDEVMARTVRLLSQLTHQVAVVRYPRRTGERVRHLDLVPLEPDTALLILITSRGRVLQQPVPLPVDAGHAGEDLALLRTRLLEELVEAPLDAAAARADTVLATLPPGAREAGARVMAGLAGLADGGAQDRLLMAGTSYLAQSTRDFRSSIAPILDALEEQVVMLRLLSELGEEHPGATGVSVRIGAENAATPLADASVVASGYGPAGSAQLGVVGPTRMDYPETMAAVRAVARYLSRLLREDQP